MPRGKEAGDRWDELAGYAEEPPSTCNLVDNGIMSNFPIDLCHKQDQMPKSPTFGAKLDTDGRRSGKIDWPLPLGTAVFRSASHCLDFDFRTRNPDYKNLVAYVDTGKHGWLDFGVQDEATLDLFLCGAYEVANFLRWLDWAGYKQIRQQKEDLYAASARASDTNPNQGGYDGAR